METDESSAAIIADSHGAVFNNVVEGRTVFVPPFNVQSDYFACQMLMLNGGRFRTGVKQNEKTREGLAYAIPRVHIESPSSCAGETKKHQVDAATVLLSGRAPPCKLCFLA